MYMYFVCLWVYILADPNTNTVTTAPSRVAVTGLRFTITCEAGPYYPRNRGDMSWYSRNTIGGARRALDPSIYTINTFTASATPAENGFVVRSMLSFDPDHALHNLVYNCAPQSNGAEVTSIQRFHTLIVQGTSNCQRLRLECFPFER